VADLAAGDAQEQPRPRLVTTGRTATILWTTVGLSCLAWIASAVVSTVAPERVLLHAVPLDLPGFLTIPGLLILLLVVICLNRLILHGVAWITAGCVANGGELLATGAVADYIPIRGSAWSLGDVDLAVGIGLLALGALQVVAGGLTRRAWPPREGG
jgi:hypothetical protein